MAITLCSVHNGTSEGNSGVITILEGIAESGFLNYWRVVSIGKWLLLESGHFCNVVTFEVVTIGE